MRLGVLKSKESLGVFWENKLSNKFQRGAGHVLKTNELNSSTLSQACGAS